MVTRWYLKVVTFLIQWLSPATLERIILRALYESAKRVPAEEALFFMFRLDAALYSIEGQMALAYGERVHPKHRLIGYHKYFISRIGASDRVIDVGCGTGAVAYDIAKETGAVVDGVDYNPKNIELARQLFVHPNVNFIEGDALNYKFGRSYNIVILSNVLEHIDERSEFLGQLIKRTRADKFLIRVPIFERDWRVALRRELGLEWRLDLDHKIEYSVESFLQETIDAGLIVRHLEVRWGEIWSELTVVDD